MIMNLFVFKGNDMHDFSIASTYYCKGEVFLEFKIQGR